MKYETSGDALPEISRSVTGSAEFVFRSMKQVSDVFAFIDGFNVYHTLESHYQKSTENLKWLNYPKLISDLAKQDVPSGNIWFFTAEPTHLSFDKKTRHQIYCKSQEMLGVNIIQGRFKKSDSTCKVSAPSCGKHLQYTIHQEKQTDVSIALKVIEMAYAKPKSRFYLLTADTDQIPTAEMIKRLFPNIRFYWVYPKKQRHRYHGVNQALTSPKQALSLNWTDYKKCQMPYMLTVGQETLKCPYLKC